MSNSKILQAAFAVRALSHSPRFLKVTWGDGAESAFPNTWLRASVRDPRFFNHSGCEYRPEHFLFTTKGLPIVAAEQTSDGENVKLIWDDHTSTFNVPWLRVQDSQSSRYLAKPMEEILWTSKDDLPDYNFSDKEDKFESWMSDLSKRGVIVVHECPPNDKGMLDFMHMIGVPLRRTSPVASGIYTIQTNPMLKRVHFAYAVKILEAHTDEVDVNPLPKLGSLLCTELDAPVKATETFVVDAFKVLQDLRKDDPKTFQILSTTPSRFGRRATLCEEDCLPSEQRIYKWDTLVEQPLVLTEGTKVKRVRIRRGKKAGFDPGTYSDEYLLAFYRAEEKFHDRLNDPYYRKVITLKPGMMLIFDNHRLCHGRLEIHPSTRRTLRGLYITEEIWRSRWRFLLGYWARLEDKWLYGCSDEALSILAQRKDMF